MNCEAYRDLVAAHIDGQLSEVERALVDQHVGACPSCEASRREQAEVVAILRDHRSHQPTPELLRAAIKRRTSSAAREPRSTRRTVIVMAGAIAATLLLTLLPNLLSNDSGVIPGGVIPTLAADIPRSETSSPAIRTVSAAALRSYYSDNGMSFERTVDDLGPFGFDLVGGSTSQLGDIPSTLTVYKLGGEQMLCRRFRAADFQWPDGGRRIGQSEVFTHDGVYVALTRLSGDVICAMTSRMPPERFLSALHGDH